MSEHWSAVFLDRDGTINVKAPEGAYIERPEDLILLDGAGTAIHRLTQLGVPVIVVTNQRGIARGGCHVRTWLGSTPACGPCCSRSRPQFSTSSSVHTNAPPAPAESRPPVCCSAREQHTPGSTCAGRSSSGTPPRTSWPDVVPAHVPSDRQHPDLLADVTVSDLGSAVDWIIEQAPAAALQHRA